MDPGLRRDDGWGVVSRGEQPFADDPARTAALAVPRPHASVRPHSRTAYSMLETLTVKDFAIVAEADIAFGPGMTAVTGETGAGKSLIVDALLLLAGGRAE